MSLSVLISWTVDINSKLLKWLLEPSNDTTTNKNREHTVTFTAISSLRPKITALK